MARIDRRTSKEALQPDTRKRQVSGCDQRAENYPISSTKPAPEPRRRQQNDRLHQGGSRQPHRGPTHQPIQRRPLMRILPIPQRKNLLSFQV